MTKERVCATSRDLRPTDVSNNVHRMIALSNAMTELIMDFTDENWMFRLPMIEAIAEASALTANETIELLQHASE